MSLQSHKGQILPLINQLIPISKDTTFHASYNKDLYGFNQGQMVKPIGHRKSLRVDGTGYVSASASALPKGNESFTAMVWFKLDSLPPSRWDLWSWGSAGQYLFNAVDVYSNKINFYNYTNDPTAIDYTFTTGVWYFFAVSWNGTTLYETLFDGTSWVKTTTNLPAFQVTANTQINIGRDKDRGAEFKGSISDLSVWNYAMTELQIQATCNKSLNGNETGLVGYWKLNEESGKIAYDASVSSSDGMLYGGATWSEGRAVATLRSNEGKFGQGVAVEQGTTNIIPGGMKNMYPSYGNGHETYNVNQYNNNQYFSIGTITSVTDNIVTYAPDHGLRMYDVVTPQTTGGGVTAGTNYFVKAISSTQFTLHAYDGSQDGSKGFAVHDSIKKDIRIPINATDFPTMWWGPAHLPNSGLVKEVIPNGFSFNGRTHDCLRMYTNFRTDGVADYMAYGVNPQINANTQYTFSFYHRAVTPESVGRTSNFELHNGVTFNYTNFTLKKEWQRYVVTVSSTMTGGASMYWNAGSGLVWEIAEIQCEEKSFGTSFTESTRPIGSLAYPKEAFPLGDFTVNMWISPSSPAGASYLYGTTFFTTATDRAKARLDLWNYDPLGPDSRRIVMDLGNNSSGGRQYQDQTGEAFVYGKWEMLTITFNLTTKLFKTYRNGVSWGGYTVEKANDIEGIFFNPAGWLFSDVRIDARIAPDDEILSWYHGGPMYNYLDYSGVSY